MTKKTLSTKISVPELPPRLLIDLRTDCNLKCPMCIVHGQATDEKLKGFLRRDMSLDNARQILDEVMSAKPLVQPNLWSEPLLINNLHEHFSAMKERGVNLSINTNGLTLKRETAEFFVDIKLDSISFSIDSTSKETLKKVRGIDKLDKIHNAVSLMLEVRGDKKLPRIGVSFALQDANRHEHDAFVEFWKNKVDFVRVGEVYEEKKFPNMKALGERKPCPSLYSVLTVHVDGNASICCLDGFGETNLGNVFEEGVKGVWHGKKFEQIRSHHENGDWDSVPFCKDCDRWASYDYEEEVKDGILIRRSLEYTYYNRIERLDNLTQALLWTEKI